MLATIADVAKKGVTKEEVERIKRQILKQRELDPQTAHALRWNSASGPPRETGVSTSSTATASKK